MKIPEMNKVYVLNPHYHLRHDIHRVALFSSTGTDTDCSRNWHTFIHPLQAVMLSFFTYDRPLQTTLPLLCDFFCRSKEEMIKWVSDFIDNPTPIYTSSQQGEIYFPKRILIEAEKAGKALRFDRLQANSFVWKKLDLTTRRLYSGPLLLTFMLTNQCVTHCKYCYADTSTQIKSPLTTQRMMELIKEASDLQVQQVNLIGGEIFLHKDWKIILKELVKRGIAPEFISTKMPVTQKLLQDVQETGYQGIVQISLDAIHSEILTASLGVNGNYAKEMLHGLQLLDDSGLNYQISSVLTNYNCQMNVLAELLHELSHLKHIRDWRIIPASNSIYKEYNVFSHLKPTKAQITKVFNQIRPLLTQVSFPVILGKEVKRKRRRYLLLCCWFFLVGMKRIAIPAVVLFILIALLLRKRKVPSWFYPAVGGCYILFFLAFLYCVRYGIISRLLNSVGVDMMGRDYLWSMANPYYEFSITYLGHGFEYVDTIIGQWYSAGLINHPYPFHNDILKVFVEVGFPGFLLWSGIQYVLTPLFWQRYADQETTLLYLSELGYMTVTYLTDNTAFYFWSTMALRLVTFSYAMERKKPPEPKVWMPDSRQEMRDRIRILMKEV